MKKHISSIVLKEKINNYRDVIEILKETNKTGILISSIVNLQNKLKRAEKKLDCILFLEKYHEK